MPETIINVQQLSRYFGAIKAVSRISFQIERGQVVGFIGANGAGKTTTMRCMATLDIPSYGLVEVCGHNVISSPHEVRRKIGWMPDAYGTYKDVTVFEYLDFYARAYGYKGAERKRRVQEIMEFTDLGSISERLMNKLSKGMGQRLCLGRTLIHDPEVLILDEPAAGLDPKARIEFKNLVRILADQGKTIFISSHILSELGEMCDTLLFIDAGEIVHHGSAESLQTENRSTQRVEVRILGDVSTLAEWVELRPNITLSDRLKDGCIIELESAENEALAILLKSLIQEDFQVIGFQRVQLKLEDAFVDMLKKLELKNGK